MVKSCIESAKFDSSENIKLQRFHQGAEIILIEKGDIKITARESTFFAGEGSLVFLDNLEEYKVEVISPEYERFCVSLKDLSVFKELIEPELLLYLRKSCSQNNRIISLGSERDEARRIFKKIVDEFESPDTLSDEVINMLVRMIFITVYRIKKDDIPDTLTGKIKSVFDIQTYIENNFRSPIKIGDLAAMFYMDKFYLSHIFKSATGYTVKEFLTLTRLNHAKKLILETPMKISEVCFESGFSDVNSFIGYFKREYGLTPAAYRKSAGKESAEDE